VTLISGSEVTEGHSNWYHSKDWVRFPIRLPLWFYLASVPRENPILVANCDFFHTPLHSAPP